MFLGCVAVIEVDNTPDLTELCCNSIDQSLKRRVLHHNVALERDEYPLHTSDHRLCFVEHRFGPLQLAISIMLHRNDF